MNNITLQLTTMLIVSFFLTIFIVKPKKNQTERKKTFSSEFRIENLLIILALIIAILITMILIDTAFTSSNLAIGLLIIISLYLSSKNWKVND